MHPLVESRIGIGLRLVSIGKVFSLDGINGTTANRFRRKTLIKVFGEQELPVVWIAYKYLLFVIGLRVFQIQSQGGIARGCLFSECAPKSINKIISVDWIAVGPTAILPQVK